MPAPVFVCTCVVHSKEMDKLASSMGTLYGVVEEEEEEEEEEETG